MCTRRHCSLQEVESRYRANPYHNAMHAADVTQSALTMLAFDNMAEHLSDLELMCVIISCCIHDVGHYGVNNDFLVKTQHEWALIYNDTSVNENMHVRVAFEILQDSQCNIFESELHPWLAVHDQADPLLYPRCPVAWLSSVCCLAPFLEPRARCRLFRRRLPVCAENDQGHRAHDGHVLP